MKRTKIINNMKALKIFAVAAGVMILAAPGRANFSSADVPAAQRTPTSRTKNNGAAAGKALLALYTQYKSDGSLDMTNPTNILNMVALADNIKELKSSVNTTNFIAGLISGSGKLVNNSNSGTVIGSLTKLAGMDLSSLRASAKTAAKTAAGQVSGQRGTFKAGLFQERLHRSLQRQGGGFRGIYTFHPLQDFEEVGIDVVYSRCCRFRRSSRL